MTRNYHIICSKSELHRYVLHSHLARSKCPVQNQSSAHFWIEIVVPVSFFVFCVVFSFLFFLEYLLHMNSFFRCSGSVTAFHSQEDTSRICLRSRTCQLKVNLGVCAPWQRQEEHARSFWFSRAWLCTEGSATVMSMEILSQTALHLRYQGLPCSSHTTIILVLKLLRSSTTWWTRSLQQI